MPNGSGIFCHLEKLENSLHTITDEIGSGQINIATPTGLEDDARAPRERNPVLLANEDVMLDGKRHNFEIAYRPNQPPPPESLVSNLDNGRGKPPANDNRPARYHLQEMAQRGELGIHEPENRRHWFDAERLKRDIAISTGELLNDSAANDWRELAAPHIGPEPESLATDTGLILVDDLEFQDSDVPGECAVVDNAEGECDQIRFLQARQVISLAEDVLGDDYTVLTSAIVNNWTARTIGENEGFMDRASASACGKGMLRSALRNLSRFYLRLDRLEHSGCRPLDVWPLIGTPTAAPSVVYPGPFRWQGKSYWNQARGPVIQVPERVAA
jgi:hypothetical protein